MNRPRNSQPRQLAPLDYKRAARGHRIARGTGRPGKQVSPMNVKTAGTLHVSWDGPEDQGRKQLLALVATLTAAGFSNVCLEGPTVVPPEPFGPRGLQ